MEFRKRVALVVAAALVVSAAIVAGSWYLWKPRKPIIPVPPQAVAPAPEKKVLDSALAGTWYEADPSALSNQIAQFLQQVPGEPLPDVQALILPHAGYRYSGQTAAYGIKQIAHRAFPRVVVMGPSHGVPMENLASVPEVTHYATPLGEVPLDLEFIAALKQHPCFRTVPFAHEGEHSVQIEVPLLQHALDSFKLVPIVMGRLDLETAQTMARVLAGLIDRDTLVIASSDFTHYGPRFGYVPFRDNVTENVKKLDMKAFASIEKKDPSGLLPLVEDEGITVCGYCPITVLLAMLPSSSEIHLLHYETSASVTGDLTNTVSYLAVAATGRWEDLEPLAPTSNHPTLSEEDKRRLLELARGTLAFALEHRRVPEPRELGIEITPGMKQTMGAFVTLHKNGELRGCVGEVAPLRPVYKAVMAQALNAALNDRRFPPVQSSEVPELEFEISVFPEGPRAVGSSREITLGQHGIVLEKDGHQALFLPQVPLEMSWTLEETLEHLSIKAGLARDAWKDGASFAVFEAEVFREHPA